MPSDINNTLMQMLLNRKLQQESDERRNQAAMQQSVLKQRSDIAKENRQFQREIVKEAVKSGDPQTVELALSGNLMGLAQRSRDETDVASAAGSGDPNRVVDTFRGLEQSGRLRSAPLSLANQQGAKREQALLNRRREEAGAIRSDNVKAARDSVAAQATRFRTLGGEPPDVDTLARELRSIAPDLSEKQRRTVLAAGIAQSDTEVAKELLKQRSKEGETVDQKALRGIQYANRNDGSLAGAPADTVAALNLKGLAVSDPIAPGDDFILFQDKGSAREWQTSRVATRNLMILGEDVQNAFVAAEENADPLLVGPIIGGDTAQSLLRSFGAEDPFAAAYSVTSFRFVSAVLKATQGSRPSDFDLRMYMALLPSLTEIGSDSAAARFQEMNQSLAVAAATPFDKELGERVERIRNQRPSRADRVLTGAAKALERAEESGDIEKIRSATTRFQRAHADWVASGRADDFTLAPRPGASQDAQQTQRVRSIVDELAEGF